MIKLIDDACRQPFNDLATSQGLLPIKVTPHYQSLVAAEVATLTGGPLFTLNAIKLSRFGVQTFRFGRDWSR